MMIYKITPYVDKNKGFRVPNSHCCQDNSKTKENSYFNPMMVNKSTPTKNYWFNSWDTETHSIIFKYVCLVL